MDNAITVRNVKFKSVPRGTTYYPKFSARVRVDGVTVHETEVFASYGAAIAAAREWATRTGIAA